MRHCIRTNVNIARAAVLGISFAALAASAFAAEYKMTVNKDRLINAQNEPQNWLMMNGDYGSTRYSKLTQINRDSVKNLRLVWALALRGMQDVGQNGPENEVNPLIDNGFMYTVDGWGTVYKIDARNPDHGELHAVAGTREGEPAHPLRAGHPRAGIRQRQRDRANAGPATAGR